MRHELLPRTTTTTTTTTTIAHEACRSSLLEFAHLACKSDPRLAILPELTYDTFKPPPLSFMHERLCKYRIHNGTCTSPTCVLYPNY